MADRPFVGRPPRDAWLSLPALFIHGEGDPLPASASADTAALIQGARVVIIPESGHFPWLERKGAVREAVESLLAGGG